MPNYAETIANRLRQERNALLDLTLRNPLLNFRLFKARGIALQDVSAAELYSHLSNDGSSVTFLPQPEPPAANADGTPAPPLPKPLPQLRGRTLRVPSAHRSAELDKRLLTTYERARTAVEEQGVNVLFLALGQLIWYEDATSTLERQAPLLLLAVTLRREQVGSDFELRLDDSDLKINLSLQAKLRDYNVLLPDLPEEEIGPADYAALVQAAIANQPRWRVATDTVALDLFQYNTFLMFRDLDADNWPPDAHPANHPIVSALLGEGFRHPPSPYSDDTFVDNVPEATTLKPVLDADSSQIGVLLDVRAGRPLVVQGPPGTGKSQTITNLLADALGSGKRVLFVAEKLAALEVVKRRLDLTGLGDAVLELHSYRANKRNVLAQIEHAASLSQPPAGARAPTQLPALRDTLNAYSAATNTPVGSSGLTPYDLYGRLIALRALLADQPPCELTLPALADWSLDDADAARRAIDDLIALLRLNTSDGGRLEEHPFAGSRLTSIDPARLRRCGELIEAALAAYQALDSALADLDARVALPSLPSLAATDALAAALAQIAARPNLAAVDPQATAWGTQATLIADGLAAWERISTLRAELATVVVPHAWHHDWQATRQALAAYGNQWYRLLVGAHRRAVNDLRGMLTGDLPTTPAARLAIVDHLIEAQQLAPQGEAAAPLLSQLFGTRWQGAESEWPALRATADWLRTAHTLVANGALPAAILGRLSSTLPAAALAALHTTLVTQRALFDSALHELTALLQIDLAARFAVAAAPAHIPRAALHDMLLSWRARQGSVTDWAALQRQLAALHAAGLAPVAQAALAWRGSPEMLTALFNRAWYEALLQRARQTRPELANFNGAVHSKRLDDYRRLDQQQLTSNRAALIQHYHAGLPRASGGGQWGVLQREFKRKRRHLPVRALMKQAGNAIQAIKPIFMMSPLSIAIYLPPGALQFDLVVFDEASQVRPVDAFGALLRARQAIVVGDDRQLPPTSFFNVVGGDEDETDDDTLALGDTESVLGAFLAQGAPSRLLRWHYRSRHQSLIAVSNQEFYDNRLIIFPSPHTERGTLGVVLHHLPEATYEPGRLRRNDLEAQAVAAAVIHHAQHSPQLTLGVAAFSIAQADAIRDNLERLRRLNPQLEPFFSAGRDEPFFVKNLENVQGDERDVILISVGYGRQADGRISMNFGPLNRTGGERRLNVLITRARLRCEVFSNLSHEDIDLSRTQARGVVSLKTYLQYAAGGGLQLALGQGRAAADSPFELAVADALRAHGYRVEHQIGTAGYFIDLAVVDPQRPGRYLLGIECDGAMYHSARAARDRDRLRQTVLEGLHWRLHRIWSTDWFQKPDEELARLLGAIADAQNGGTVRPAAAPAPATPPATPAAALPPPAAPPVVAPPAAAAPPADAPTRIAASSSGSVQWSTVALPYLPAGGMTLHYDGERFLRQGRMEPIQVLVRIVEVEQPIHVELLYRRLADTAGVSRIGGRVRLALERLAARAVKERRVAAHGDFFWLPDQYRVHVSPRDRSAQPSAARKVELIAPEEIAGAIVQTVDQSIGIGVEELSTAVANLLGYRRVSAEVQAAILVILGELLADDGVLEQVGGMVRRRLRHGPQI